MSKDKIPLNLDDAPETEKSGELLKFPSTDQLINFLNSYGIVGEEVQKVLKKVEKAINQIKDMSGPSSDDIVDKLAGAFTIINNIFGDEEEKADQVTDELQNLITGENPSLEVSSEEKETKQAPVENKPVEGKKLTRETIEQEKIKSKVEISKEFRKIQEAINNLRKKWFALGNRWEDYQSQLDNFQKRLEDENLTTKLAQEWEDLSFQINQDIKLEQDKAESPEKVAEKKKQEQEKRITQVNFLRTKIEALKVNTVLGAELREFEYNLEKITEEINNLELGEGLKQIDEKLSKIEKEFNNFTKDIKVEDISQEVKEILEQKLTYLDIEPQEIFNLMTEADMRNIKASLLEKGGEEKVIDYFKNLINQIIVKSEKQELFTNKKIEETAETINKIFQESIEAEARRNLMKIDMKKIGKGAWKILKNFGLYFGAGMAIGGMGITTAGLGTAAGFSLLSLGLRKWEQRKKKENAAKTKEKFEKELAAEKESIIKAFFTDINKTREKFSGIISNEIRRKTSKESIDALKGYEEAGLTSDEAAIEVRLAAVEKELFTSALTMIKAEYKDFPPEQQKHMAVAMAMTLAQHERNEHQGRKRLEDLQNNKPKIAQFLKKFNAWRTGTVERKPAGVDQKLWDKYKYEAAALAIGTGVGLAIRTSGTARIAFGALTGIGLGLGWAESWKRKQERKGFTEVEKMIDEAEEIIKDIEFPAEELIELRKNSELIQSRLELGLLDANQILKSRAENFIHNVNKLEIANQKVLEDLLKQQEENRESLEKKIEEDVSRIEAKTKRGTVIRIVGGAIAGALTAGALTEEGKDLLGFPPNIEEVYKGNPDFTLEEINNFATELNLDKPILTGEEYLNILTSTKKGHYPELTRDLYEHYNQTRGTWEATNSQGAMVIFRDPDGDGLPEVKGVDGKFKQAQSLEDVRQVLGLGKTPEFKTGAETSVREQIVEDVSQTKEAAVEKAEVIENKIDSSELEEGRHDSVWHSTLQMVKEKADKLGFDGKEDELNKWAERQTNLLVNNLDKNTEGGIKDLVHDGDYVFLEQKGDKWELGFRADSGIAPDYLPEVEKINLEDLKVEDLLKKGDVSWQRYLESKVNDLEQQQEIDLDRTGAAFGAGEINREVYNESLEMIKNRYGIDISVYQQMLENAKAKEVSDTEALTEADQGVDIVESIDKQQQAFESLKRNDPTGPVADYSKYEQFLGTADSPNQEMINLIMDHATLKLEDLQEINDYDSLIETKLGTDFKGLNLENIYKLWQFGYSIKEQTVGDNNHIFNNESTLVFGRSGHPNIYINKGGNYGFATENGIIRGGAFSEQEDIFPTTLASKESEFQEIVDTKTDGEGVTTPQPETPKESQLEFRDGINETVREKLQGWYDFNVAEIKEFNERLDIWKDKYGDKPEFIEFEKWATERSNLLTLRLDKFISDVKNSDTFAMEDINEVSGSPRDTVDHMFSTKAAELGLVTTDEAGGDVLEKSENIADQPDSESQPLVEQVKQNSLGMSSEAVNEFREKGYNVKTEGEMTVFQKGNGPEIHIDLEGNYSFEINGELSKAGKISTENINSVMLDKITDKYERLSIQEELTGEPEAN